MFSLIFNINLLNSVYSEHSEYSDPIEIMTFAVVYLFLSEGGFVSLTACP